MHGSIQWNRIAVGAATADDYDDNNNSFNLHLLHSATAGKRIKHFRWNEISHGKFGGKHFRPAAPACIHIIIHTFMLRLRCLMRHIHLNYSGLLVAVSVCVRELCTVGMRNMGWKSSGICICISFSCLS